MTAGRAYLCDHDCDQVDTGGYWRVRSSLFFSCFPFFFAFLDEWMIVGGMICGGHYILWEYDSDVLMTTGTTWCFGGFSLS